MSVHNQERSHEDLKDLIEENKKLLEDNHTLLRDIRRSMRYGLILKVVWYALIIGVPLVLYYYVLDPYVAALGFNLDGVKESIENSPFSKFFHP